MSPNPSLAPASSHAQEVGAGERFRFGANWARFLQHRDERRIQEAERSLQHMLKVASLQARRMLDAGSGSGLFSLAADRLAGQLPVRGGQAGAGAEVPAPTRLRTARTDDRR